MGNEKDYLIPGDGDGFGNFLKGQLGLPGKVVINKPKEKTYTVEEGNERAAREFGENSEAWGNEKMYTRDEVIDMIVHYYRYSSSMLNEGYHHPSKDFPNTWHQYQQEAKEWFDLNYPAQ